MQHPCQRISLLASERTNRILIARVGAACTLLVLLTGSIFGRSLQLSFPQFVRFIPYLGWSLLVGALLFAVGFAAVPVREKTSASFKKTSLFKALILTISLGAAISITTTLLVQFPIEKIHLVKYGALSFFLYFSQQSTGRTRKMFIAAACAGIIGVVEECIQYFHPQRVFDTRDILLNFSGAVFGTLVAWITTYWKRIAAREV